MRQRLGLGTLFVCLEAVETHLARRALVEWASHRHSVADAALIIAMLEEATASLPVAQKPFMGQGAASGEAGWRPITGSMLSG